MSKKICSFILGAVLVLSLSTVAVKASSLVVTLDVNGVKQEQTNWCWAACTKCVADYLGGKGLSQTQIVEQVKGEWINEGASSSEQSDALNDDGVTTTFVNRAITWTMTRIQLDNNKPVLSHIKWTSNNTGHAEVIYGYNPSTTSSTHYIYFMNPGKSSNTWNICLYSSYVSNSSWNWIRTYYKNQLS